MEIDVNLYDKCSRDVSAQQRSNEQSRIDASNKWQLLIKEATSKGIDVSSL